MILNAFFSNFYFIFNYEYIYIYTYMYSSWGQGLCMYERRVCRVHRSPGAGSCQLPDLGGSGRAVCAINGWAISLALRSRCRHLKANIWAITSGSFWASADWKRNDVARLYEVVRRQLNLVWQIFRADICYQMSEAQIFLSRKQGTLIFFSLLWNSSKCFHFL